MKRKILKRNEPIRSRSAGIVLSVLLGPYMKSDEDGVNPRAVVIAELDEVR